MYIAGNTHLVFILFNKKGFESSLEKVPNSLVFQIIPVRVHSSKPLHTLKNIGFINNVENHALWAWSEFKGFASKTTHCYNLS
ncbi:hypothetical protein KsCSTR_23160 [Candidatus Kuenenia stuttgartiensis]|uniref:Uncharacterized protein n=1 Tax=Kuenenia stuttgartiensis TaxID=174633 RepID=Q1Q3J9_KUEST|nr:hypothetical protein [Candidatus Kuenenia stuttgartiensis]QII11695.1 hypothetical protein KsCSTR_23160 [Candidatus Kuenenia stuttgartiensis]CAJ74585.1 unknown protein [Candidatus Kuenenia stuttgartiensis]